MGSRSGDDVASNEAFVLDHETHELVQGTAADC